MKFPPSNASLTSLLRGLLIFEIVYGVIVLAISFFESYLEGQFWSEIGLTPGQDGYISQSRHVLYC